MIILRYVFLGLVICIVAAIGWRPSVLSRLAGMRHGAEVAILAGTKPVPPRPMRSLPVPHLPMPAAPMPKALSTPTPKALSTHDEIVKRLDEVPQFSAFYKDLATGFPHVYGDLVDHAAQTMTAGNALPSSGALIWNALRGLQQSNGILAAGADEAALAMFFDARLAMLDVLATVDARTCADFLYGATDPSIEEFSLKHRDLVADMAGKQLAAIEDGQRRHLDPGAPSADDIDLVAGGLTAKSLSPDEISMLLDGKSIDPPLPDARLCEIGRTYLSVLKDLPPASRQRIYGFAAELLARS